MNAQIRAELDAICKTLEVIEEHMAWMIRAGARFRVGQRVEWSRKGRKCGFPNRKVAQRGNVKSIDALSIVVKLDGIKHAKSYHHAFFNPVYGPKLF